MPHSSGITISAYWNLSGLISWIFYRDIQQAEYWNAESKSAALVFLLTGAEHDALSPNHAMSNITATCNQIIYILCSGDISGKAVKQHKGPLETIEPDEWGGREFQFDPDVAVQIAPNSSRYHKWTGLLFSSIDAQKIWPNTDPSNGNTAPALKPLPVKSQREIGKVKTSQRHKRWDDRATELRLQYPDKKEDWIAWQISKEPIGEGRQPETIRRIISGHKRK